METRKNYTFQHYFDETSELYHAAQYPAHLCSTPLPFVSCKSLTEETQKELHINTSLPAHVV